MSEDAITLSFTQVEKRGKIFAARRNDTQNRFG